MQKPLKPLLRAQLRSRPFAVPQPSPSQNVTSLGSSDMRADNPTRASYSSPREKNSQAAPPPTLLRLTPRPGFKVRVSRSRPAPKVSIVLSNVPASNSQVQASPNRGGAGGSVLGESPRQGQPKVEGGGDGCRTVEVSSEEGMKRGRCVENEEGGRGGGGASTTGSGCGISLCPPGWRG